MKTKKRGRVSDVDLPLPSTLAEAETRKQIRERKGLSHDGVKRFLDSLDDKGILRARRVVARGPGGMRVTTIVYWIEKDG